MAGQSAQITFAFLAKDAASKSINAIGRNLKSLGGVAKTIGKGIAIGIGAIAAGFAAAAYAAKGFVQSAIEDIAAQTKLVSVLQARKLATEANLAAVDELIKAGQNLAFTDDEIRAGIATATQFTKSFADAQKILTTAQDVARAKGISLEEATALVGKAYQGNTRGLKQLGIETKKGAKGLAVLTSINRKFAGVAAKNADTVSAQFEIFRIKIDEAKESIGGALLPAVMKVFKALQPIVDSLLGDLEKKLPDLEQFANTIADKLVRQIPKWVATAKRELPPLIEKVKSFFLEATKFSDSAVKALGPDGLITTGIAAIGFKIGGLKGALAGALTKGFSDVGLGPFESLLAGAVGSAILAGLAEGLASQAALALIAAFKARMTAASSIPTPIPGGGGGGGVPPIIPGGGAAATTGLGALAASFAAPLAVVAAGAVAMTGIFAIGAKLITQGDTLAERERKWAEWERSKRTPSFGGKFLDPMSAKYSTPEFNVYVGGTAVADAVVPILARDYSVNPKGGK
ncbi:MAG: hypothetical protein EBR82_40140 [Caulobacteraceae bacterium]|nr:hypothetical protein [Caulobacteraceae bacterium]